MNSKKHLEVLGEDLKMLSHEPSDNMVAELPKRRIGRTALALPFIGLLYPVKRVKNRKIGTAHLFHLLLEAINVAVPIF